MNPEEIYNGQPVARQNVSPESTSGATKSIEVAEPLKVGAEGESASAKPTSGDPAMANPTNTQLPQVTPDPAQNASASTDDSPLVAADDEVIEREWVQKAKQIVTQTRDDPYAQEKEVGKLQSDYVKKRYGKDLKLASD